MFIDGGYLVGVGPYGISVDDTCFCIELQARCLELLVDLLLSLLVLRYVFAMDYDVVHVDGHTLQTLQGLNHFPLEDLGCGNPEWRSLKQYYPNGVMNVVNL